MKCPECVKKGKKSIVTQGAGFTTAMYFPIQYDEDGNLMDTGHNQTTLEYSCSNGHTWTEQL